MSGEMIALKSDVLFSLRSTLHAQGFVEVVTPTVRKADLGAGRRLRSASTRAGSCGR